MNSDKASRKKKKRKKEGSRNLIFVTVFAEIYKNYHTKLSQSFISKC